MRLVAIFSMTTGAILRAAWGSLAVHERTLLHQVWDALQAADVALADRGFCGFADFWLLLQRGVHCVMRKHQRRSSGQRTLRRLGKGDLLAAGRKTGPSPAWLPPGIWSQMTEEMIVRQIEVSVGIPGFRTETLFLVTTLLDKRRFAKADFADLYRRRWLAELFLRDIKISLGMDTLKCKSPAMALKELAIYLIAYNVIRSVMLQAAQAHDSDPLRIRFKRTADALRQWEPVIRAAHPCAGPTPSV